MHVRESCIRPWLIPVFSWAIREMQKWFSAWQPFAGKRWCQRALLAFSWLGRGHRVVSSRIEDIACLKMKITKWREKGALPLEIRSNSIPRRSYGERPITSRTTSRTKTFLNYDKTPSATSLSLPWRCLCPSFGSVEEAGRSWWPCGLCWDRRPYRGRQPFSFWTDSELDLI